MRTLSINRLLVLGGLLMSVSACAGEDAETAPASVSFVEPSDGATLTGPDVNVALEVEGIEIAPATDTREGTGHHHIFIDDAVTPSGQAIPQGQANVRHFGTGATEFVLTDMQPGQHRLIAVVGDAAHVPVEGMATDTITITVTAPAAPMTADTTAADTAAPATPPATTPGG
jgi:hypothetical protein